MIPSLCENRIEGLSHTPLYPSLFSDDLTRHVVALGLSLVCWRLEALKLLQLLLEVFVPMLARNEALDDRREAVPSAWDVQEDPQRAQQKKEPGEPAEDDPDLDLVRGDLQQ